MKCIKADVHKGSLPLSHSFVRLSPSNLVLTSIKKAEDSDAWVIQWYDAGGRESDAQLTLSKKPKKVVTSGILEEDGVPIAVSGSTVNVPTKKSSVVTVKVYF